MRLDNHPLILRSIIILSGAYHRAELSVRSLSM
ncbi:hypothetical protein AWB67_02216 [Caballeronia terrestris]|uniref:Uncharacterized protein n=1 Tax=Caballeronia terrestris TaxID=1226301 RepID=A0A158HWS3_9BURK|nr:hypothetical protein AWB67_02216 [Caballeronia terrestris]